MSDGNHDQQIGSVTGLVDRPFQEYGVPLRNPMRLVQEWNSSADGGGREPLPLATAEESRNVVPATGRSIVTPGRMRLFTIVGICSIFDI